MRFNIADVAIEMLSIDLGGNAKYALGAFLSSTASGIAAGAVFQTDERGEIREVERQRCEVFIACVVPDGLPAVR
jgi:hypothetical protein